MKVTKTTKKQAERPRQSPQNTRKNQRKNKTNKGDRCVFGKDNISKRIVITLLHHRGNTVAEVTTDGHSPTSSNGLTIIFFFLFLS